MERFASPLMMLMWEVLTLSRVKPHAFCVRIGLIHDGCSLKNCSWGFCKKCKQQTLGDELNDDRLCPPCEDSEK